MKIILLRKLNIISIEKLIRNNLISSNLIVHWLLFVCAYCAYKYDK